jgi:DNA-binding beta-propeller fold protein YncE
MTKHTLAGWAGRAGWAGLFLLAVTLRAQTKVPQFAFDSSFPQMPAGKVFGDVSSVTTDSANHVWVIHRPRTVMGDRSNVLPPVVEFDESGKYLAAWGGPGAGYEWPEREHGIFVDAAGDVWVSGNNGFAAAGAAPPPGKSDDMLLKFTGAGKFLLQFGHAGASKGDADNDNVKQAADMQVFKGELFVADGYGNHRVVVLDAKTGKFKRAWKANGSTPFDIVHAIEVSNDGLVYVADRQHQRVQVFTTAGAFRQEAKVGGENNQMSGAAGLAFSPDRAQQFLYVGDLGNNQVDILDRRSMKVLGKFGKAGAAPGDFNILHEIAADSKGSIYTAETRSRRVQKFKPVS